MASYSLTHRKMSDTTIQHLFRSLEHTVRERLDCIREVIQTTRGPQGPQGVQENTNYYPSQDTPMLLQHIQALNQRNHSLEEMMHGMRNELNTLRSQIQESLGSPRDILPLHPIDGIEVIPKREVVLGDGSLSVADRLLLNRKARRALEAQEMGEVPNSVSDGGYTEEEETAEAEAEAEEEAAAEAEAEAEAEPEAEAEAEEAEAEPEPEPEAEELEEFEYKGTTYYRDSENRVFMTDDNGELVEESIGVWSSLKNRIIVAKKV